MKPEPRSRTPATPQQVAAAGSAVRLRILRLCHPEALTNKEIAERLGRDPATTLYHVRRLVDAELLAALPVRRGARGSRERPYRAIGLSWRLSMGEAPGVREAMLEAFLGEVAEVGVERVEQTRLVVDLDAEREAEFRARLQALLDEFAAVPGEPVDTRLAVYVAAYPAETT